jgi:hydrogenase maturation protein HypF
LEGIAEGESSRLERTEYALELRGGNEDLQTLDAGRLWRTLVGNLRKGVAKPEIAARFHAGVAEGFIRAASSARERTGMNRVALSGGCMHNRRLTQLLRAGLEAEGFEVFAHRQVSPGDGGLSYGQAAVGAAILLQES